MSYQPTGIDAVAEFYYRHADKDRSGLRESMCRIEHGWRLAAEAWAAQGDATKQKWCLDAAEEMRRFLASTGDA